MLFGNPPLVPNPLFTDKKATRCEFGQIPNQSNFQILMIARSIAHLLTLFHFPLLVVPLSQKLLGCRSISRPLNEPNVLLNEFALLVFDFRSSLGIIT